MSTSILVLGESGSGKSTGLRNLNTQETYLINVMGKALPFSGGSSYETGKNMLETSETTYVLQQMDKVNREAAIKNLVIDDMQYIMATEFMTKVMVKGYDKFSIMAKNMWDILVFSNKLRKDLKVFILSHSDTVDGVRMMKTLGKLLREKITPEGIPTIVLFADVQGEENRTYFFQTQSDGATVAKSPMDMFPMYIPNDLNLVAQRIDEYCSGVSLEQTKLIFGDITRGRNSMQRGTM